MKNEENINNIKTLDPYDNTTENHKETIKESYKIIYKSFLTAQKNAIQKTMLDTYEIEIASELSGLIVEFLDE